MLKCPLLLRLQLIKQVKVEHSEVQQAQALRKNRHSMFQQLKKLPIFVKNIVNNKYHTIVFHAIKTFSHKAKFMVKHILI